MLSETPRRDEIHEQINRILAHKLFSRSKRLSKLLQTIVTQTLDNQPGALKEVNLAGLLYGDKYYDPSEQSNIRVDVSNLRKKLEQYYASDGAHDKISILIPKGSYVASLEYRTKRQPPARSRVVPVILAVSSGVILLIFGLRWRRLPMAVAEQPVQMTFDNGFTSELSISPDGDVLVYNSDRGKDGILHIWVQTKEGGQRQLTDGPAQDGGPELSPDARYVVFRSLRDGDSLFTVPVSGGAPTLLVKGANSQRFSPDGRWLTYSGRNPDSSTHIFVIDFEKRGEPQRVDFGVDHTACPVWTPDGRHIIFLAKDDHGADWDYWIAPVKPDRSGVRRLGIQALLRRQKLPLLTEDYDCPQDWIGDRLLFFIKGREPASPIHGSFGLGNVFQVLFSPGEWRVVSGVEALQPALSTSIVRVARNRGWMVFSVEQKARSIWSLDLPVAGSPVFSRVIQDDGIRSSFDGTWPGLSADGNTVCFVTERNGNPDVLCKDMISGIERLLGAQPARTSLALPNSDGQRVAFIRSQKLQSDLVVREVASGAERVISSECPVLLQWAAGESFFLCAKDLKRSDQLYRVDLATGHKSLLLTSKMGLMHAEISPDGLWLAAAFDSGRNGLLAGYLISLPENPDDISRWIKVTEEPFQLSLHWAPDGNGIYFWQVRDGSRCLWGQRLEPTTKRPMGLPFAVLHRHTYRAYPASGGTLAVSGSADRTRFAMTLSDELSDLWRVSFRK